MLNSYPRISVVTPSYNQGAYLEKTILSVINQEYPNIEYIVIDGGSTDNSLDIIKKYEKYLKYWVSEQDRGQSHAINKGFSHATGDLLTWLNSDDYYMPGALWTLATMAMANPEASAFVGTGRVIDETGNIKYYKEPPQPITIETLYRWLNGGIFMQPSSIFRRTAWELVGPLDENVHIAFDVDLWLRMAKAGCRFVSSDSLLSTALRHKNAKTTAFNAFGVIDCAIVVMRHGGESGARSYLEQVAARLAYSEPNLNKILNNPLIRLLAPAIKLFVKPAVRWREATPPWSNRNKTDRKI
jgi:glycosyltransferase involved in cell wall biosynthesis